jgi:uncharacterized protein with von Willebrand factor type A (vWA) domain
MGLFDKLFGKKEDAKVEMTPELKQATENMDARLKSTYEQGGDGQKFLKSIGYSPKKEYNPIQLHDFLASYGVYRLVQLSGKQAA